MGYIVYVEDGEEVKRAIANSLFIYQNKVYAFVANTPNLYYPLTMRGKYNPRRYMRRLKKILPEKDPFKATAVEILNIEIASEDLEIKEGDLG